MKKLLLLLFLIATNVAFGQMKTGNNPTTIGASSLLELEHPNKALVVTRVANTAAIATPVDGMIIFDISSNCFKGYQNGAWSACFGGGGVVAGTPSTNGTAVVSAYGGAGCTGSGTINGTMTQGVAVSGVTMTLYANVTTLGTYNLTASQNGVAFSGAGSFTSLGCQAITLTASGVPAAAGPFTWATNTTPIGSSTLTVAAPSAPSSNGTAVVAGYGGAGCTGSGTINGTMTVGTAVSGVTMTLYANVTTLGTYSLSAVQNGVTFTGAGSFTTLGCQAITLTATGTPTAAGLFTWATNSTPSGGGTLTVAGATSPSTNGTGVVSSFGAPSCTANAINGNMTVGVPVSGVTMSLYANVTTVGTYSITAGPTNGVTFTGSGTFAATGCQLITLTATGTPTAAGTNSFVTNTTPTATVSGSTGSPAPTNPIGLGSLSGKTCFDIALSNDNTNNCGPLSGRTATQSDFTQAATHTQVYTFTPSGTVSNVRFMYVNTNGSPIIALTGGNAANNISTAQTATVNYSTSLNATALGLTSTNALTGDIYVIYNNGATNNGSDVQLKLTATIKDCMCCGAYVAAGVFKEFMCHNLGANTSLDPHVPVQGIHGNYYQWGRSAVVAYASTPAAAIAGWNTTEAPNGSWLDASKTANDPCPSGYRVPTNAQWAGVLANNTVSRTGTWADSPTNFTTAIHWGPNATTKTLTLPAAGFRSNLDGTLSSRGLRGYYWSSTDNGANANLFYFASSNVTSVSLSRTDGFSVRCVSE